MTLPYVSIPDQRLTDHFTLYEFLRSDTAAKYAIDNTPDPGEIENIHHTAEGMEAVHGLLSAHYNVEIAVLILSGFRSDALNRHRAVGGSKTSEHRFGLAADFRAMRARTGDICDPMEVAQIISASPLMFDQLIHYRRSRNHLGFGPRNRREVKTRLGGKYVWGLVA